MGVVIYTTAPFAGVALVVCRAPCSVGSAPRRASQAPDLGGKTPHPTGRDKTAIEPPIPPQGYPYTTLPPLGRSRGHTARSRGTPPDSQHDRSRTPATPQNSTPRHEKRLKIKCYKQGRGRVASNHTIPFTREKATPSLTIKAPSCLRKSFVVFLLFAVQNLLTVLTFRVCGGAGVRGAVS